MTGPLYALTADWVRYGNWDQRIVAKRVQVSDELAKGSGGEAEAGHAGSRHP